MEQTKVHVIYPTSRKEEIDGFLKKFPISHAGLVFNNKKAGKLEIGLEISGGELHVIPLEGDYAVDMQKMGKRVKVLKGDSPYSKMRLRCNGETMNLYFN